MSDSDSDIWVLDTTSGSHFCSSLLQLQNIKDLKRGNLELYSASEESISIEAVGTCILDLPSDKILELKDYYYMPKVIRNIISIPLLLKQGYEIKLMENGYTNFFFLINFMAVVILITIF